MNLSRKKRVKKGGRDWLPGQSGNPKGRPKTPTELLEARKMLKSDFEATANKLIRLSKNDLQLVLNDPGSSVLEHVIAGILGKAMSTGDDRRMEFLLNRLVGPVPKPVELSGAGGEPLRLFEDTCAEELSKVLLELKNQIKETECRQKLQPSSGSPAPSLRPSSRPGA